MASTVHPHESSLPVNDSTSLRELTYAQTILCAALIGIAGGD